MSDVYLSIKFDHDAKMMSTITATLRFQSEIALEQSFVVCNVDSCEEARRDARFKGVPHNSREKSKIVRSSCLNAGGGRARGKEIERREGEEGAVQFSTPYILVSFY